MGLQQFTLSAAANRPIYRCSFSTLMTGISLRHSDTVDVKFLINGQPAVIALAHAGFARFQENSATPLSDAEAVEMAGLFLKRLLEEGDWSQEPILPVSAEQTLALAQQVRSRPGL